MGACSDDGAFFCGGAAAKLAALDAKKLGCILLLLVITIFIFLNDIL
jgi:hypothetical protein